MENTTKGWLAIGVGVARELSTVLGRVAYNNALNGGTIARDFNYEREYEQNSSTLSILLILYGVSKLRSA